MNKGQSMFEVVIAIFIIAMIVVGVVSLSTTSLANASYSRNKTLAEKYSQEAIEWIRNEREQNISLFITYTSIASPTYCLQSPLSWTNTGACSSTEVVTTGSIFRREVIFITSTVSTKRVIQADVKTYWNDTKGYHEVKSVTNFTDIREK